jgi:23S rRNA pseudouridine1911/1915/1917 synthase
MTVARNSQIQKGDGPERCSEAFHFVSARDIDWAMKLPNAGKSSIPALESNIPFNASHERADRGDRPTRKTDLVTSPLHVLYEDNHCLAVEKPAGLLTMGDHSGQPTLVDAAKEYLARKYDKPGNVFVGVVHRLDRPVSGVVLFARTSKGASRLSEQFRVRSVEKSYLALVEGTVSPATGLLHDRLNKDRARNVVSVVDEEGDGQDCVLSYERVQQRGRFTLVKILPQTGRSHQIRVQLSSRGWPIVGDAKYGSKTRADGFIALHAASLSFVHPTTKEPISVRCECPSAWNRLV